MSNACVSLGYVHRANGRLIRIDELEGKLREKDTAQSVSSTRLGNSPGVALVGTGRYEQLPPQSLIEELYVRSRPSFQSKVTVEYELTRTRAL